MICDKCGAKIDPEAGFCSHCGSEFPSDTGKSCGSCGTSNSADAKFCSNCGAELIVIGKESCRYCGMNNEPDSAFCANYGTQLSTGTPAAVPIRQTPKRQPPKTHKGRSVPPARRRSYVAGASVSLGLIVLVIVISQRSRNDSLSEGQVAVVETKLSKIPLAGQDPVGESKAMQIAKKFDCSCGTCGDLSLDTCTCPTAVKEREFIRKSVEERESPDQIIAAVNRTYGHMKSKTNFVVPPLSNFGGSAGIGANSGEN